MIVYGKYFMLDGQIFDVKETTHIDTTDKTEIYEVFRVENFVPLFLQDHLIRLENSLKQIHIQYNLDHKSIESYIDTLIQADNIANGNIRISCLCVNNTLKDFLIYYIPTYYPEKELYIKGVPTLLFEAERNNPNVKVEHTQVRKNAVKKIKESNVYEVLLVNHERCITEGSRSNVFFIQDKIIYTASQEVVLPGIVRSKVIHIIKKYGFSYKELSLPVSQLSKVESAFITGTSPRILPIGEIGDYLMNVNHPLMHKLIYYLNQMIEEYKQKKPIE
jgi:branched-chain amino acid aminotransferase